MSDCYIGVDVGTGSARAGVFDSSGNMLATASFPIRMWKHKPDFAEQSTDDIWSACCQAVREAVSKAGQKPDDVRGLGFDATCSLVALGGGDQPVSVSPGGKDEQNVIVWMDHRAIEQAERINRTGHKVLDYVGGKISPEMETPKLLWLKENMPDSWNRAERFYDLPDFLAHRATGADTRSLCSTVCKWTYMGHLDPNVPGSIGRWDDSYFHGIGLGDLVEDGYARIGGKVRPIGEAIGDGVSARSADELGLRRGTPVSVSIIDAHAGGIGMLGAGLDGVGITEEDLTSRLALIGGTSSCHMAVSQNEIFVPGVWGPYYSAMIPGMWLTEGGQSATGALIDHVIFSHARADELKHEAASSGRTVYEILNARLDVLSQTSDFPAELTRDLHVLPYYHGNRSPHADPILRGVVSGLKLSDTIDALSLLYLATIQAIAHGTRHIISTMNAQGFNIDTVFACGGGTKNPIFLREHADVTGCRIVLPSEPEAVLLGSAILGAVASGDFGSVIEAMSAMNKAGDVIEPAGGKVSRYHDAKYKVFHRLYENQIACRQIMSDV
ncbi:MAG: FGGY-family carbohydrate kinase [Phycisphaerae bacterium]|nr:FGGY-family carbohydrate kinase [Phycisphaerae bacterium]